MRTKVIITNNREVYNKLNMLIFKPEVLLNDVKPGYINKILRNINSGQKVLDVEHIGKQVKLKRCSDINYKVYCKQ